MSVVMIRVLVGLCGGPHNCHLIRISVCLSLSLIFCLFWLKKHWLFDRDWKKEKFYIHTRVLLGLGCTRCPLLLCFVSLLSSHLITSDFSHPCGKWLFWRIEDFKIATAIFSLIIWHHRREKNIETNKKNQTPPKGPKQTIKMINVYDYMSRLCHIDGSSLFVQHYYSILMSHYFNSNFNFLFVF